MKYSKIFGSAVIGIMLTATGAPFAEDDTQEAATGMMPSQHLIDMINKMDAYEQCLENNALDVSMPNLAGAEYGLPVMTHVLVVNRQSCDEYTI